MPENQALQVFYGTVPLMAVIIAAWMRESMLLKDILKRLSNLEIAVADIRKEVGGVKERLVALETRAGIIFH